MINEIKYFVKSLNKQNDEICYIRNKIIASKNINQSTRMRYRTLIDTLRSRIVQEINRFNFEIDKVKDLALRNADFTVNLEAFSETYDTLTNQVNEIKELDPGNNKYDNLNDTIKSNKSNDSNIRATKNIKLQNRENRECLGNVDNNKNIKTTVYDQLNRNRDKKKVENIKNKLIHEENVDDTINNKIKHLEDNIIKLESNEYDIDNNSDMKRITKKYEDMFYKEKSYGNKFNNYSIDNNNIQDNNINNNNINIE